MTVTDALDLGVVVAVGLLAPHDGGRQLVARLVLGETVGEGGIGLEDLALLTGALGVFELDVDPSPGGGLDYLDARELHAGLEALRLVAARGDQEHGCHDAGRADQATHAITMMTAVTGGTTRRAQM